MALWGAKEHTTRRNDCDDFHNEVMIGYVVGFKTKSLKKKNGLQFRTTVRFSNPCTSEARACVCRGDGQLSSLCLMTHTHDLRSALLDPSPP